MGGGSIGGKWVEELNAASGCVGRRALNIKEIYIREDKL